MSQLEFVQAQSLASGTVKGCQLYIDATDKAGKSVHVNAPVPMEWSILDYWNKLTDIFMGTPTYHLTLRSPGGYMLAEKLVTENEPEIDRFLHINSYSQ